MAWASALLVGVLSTPALGQELGAVEDRLLIAEQLTQYSYRWDGKDAEGSDDESVYEDSDDESVGESEEDSIEEEPTPEEEARMLLSKRVDRAMKTMSSRRTLTPVDADG